ncbi:MAG: proline--tRNA ligase, partial [Lentisphaerae bacterium]|nr:proline--tRNA ligase [Lentisphaerota bacterium]
FDLTLESADASYQAMYDAYTRIFDRCGLRTKVVEADTGAMGGKWSHEFMVPSENGEDGLAECENCSYAANLERAERAVEGEPRRFGDGTSEKKEPEIVDTPDMKTIEQVSAFFKCGPERFVKTLIYLVDGKPVAALVPGERALNEKKLLHALDATDLELASEEVIRTVTGADVGFAGPVGLDIPIVADTSLRGIEGAIAGANRTDAHLVNVNIERDTQVKDFHDLCLVADGDACPRCGGPLHERRGIEVGHVFKLGTKYSEALGATYLDDKGESYPMVMGCYGIGVTRTLQAVVEQCHDDNGIVWPLSIAPYQVAILPLSVEPAECAQKAETLAQELEDRGISVLLDDRDDRPGVKFKDSDLLGLPIRVVVSERSLASGDIELKLRSETEKQMVPLEDAVERICGMVQT